MSTLLQWLALTIGILAVILMSYGFGWIDGRDSMRGKKEIE